MRLASDGGGRLPGDFAPAESIRDTAEDTCRQRQLRFKLSRGNAFPIQPGGWAVGSILHQREVGAKRGSGRGAPARMSAAPRAAAAPAPARARAPAAPTSRPSGPATTASPLPRHKPGSAPQTQATIGPVLGFGAVMVQATIDRWLVWGWLTCPQGGARRAKRRLRPLPTTDSIHETTDQKKVSSQQPKSHHRD